MSKAAKLCGLILLLVLAGAFAFYQFVLPGLSSARNEPPKSEIAVATFLLRHSVPTEAKAQINPLGADPADVAAGQMIFQKNCEACHGHDGAGQTQMGQREFPRAPVLASLLPTMTDGEIFYHVRNGIRNTAMPAWGFPDREMWQLVLFIRHLPKTADWAVDEAYAHPAPGTRQFVGSDACKSCHAEIYERWKKTPMANVVRDPKAHPEAIIPDLSKPDPLLTFTKDDIGFVYGSIWKQRYFKRVGDDYFPEPAQWDVIHKVWRPYFVKNGTDWWAAQFPPDNFQRPTSQLCDGCHSVNFDVATKTPAEWNVGCESCHGPASEHVKNPTWRTVINPARLDYVGANDTCIQCHSQGRPPGNPINGKLYDWPVGFHMGAKLSDFWSLEDHKLGETSFTHFSEGTAHKNRMQGNDFTQSLMYTRGITCFSCHDVHGTQNVAELRAPPDQVCLACHGANTQNGPHAASIEEHTHHKAGSAGSQCIACHMPAIEQTIADVNVHAHTFKVITPAQSAKYQIPNPCIVCHTDKSNDWAATAMKGWTDRSPWREQD